MENNFLISTIILIATAVFIVAIFRRFKLSPVLGYLVSGTILGERVISIKTTEFLGELGVVFLLFAIGLELSIERLKAMRTYVFGLGSLQVIITGFVVMGYMFSIGVGHNASIVLAGGLALSSTAIVMQVISENKAQSTQVGRIALAILLLQDLIVVPLLVTVPLLAGQATESLSILLLKSLIKAICVLVTIFVAGRILLRPLFSFILSDVKEDTELPIAVTLLVVLAAAWSTEHYGLSLALGAFVSGVLVAETDFRITAEKSIYPFKGLLLGLFFMSVGMKIDVMEIYQQMWKILSLSLSLMAMKMWIIMGLCTIFGFRKNISLHAGLLLSQGGEFAFILFGIGKDYGIIESSTANLYLLVVTCSMALTPLADTLGSKLVEKIEKSLGQTTIQIIENGAKDLKNHIIIAGIGRVGATVANVLNSAEMNYIAVDINDNLVRDKKVNGFPVFKGDMTQISVLEALGVARCSGLVITVNNMLTVKKIIKVMKAHYPNVSLVSKIKSAHEINELFTENKNSQIMIPQNQEMGLQLGCSVLKLSGITECEIARVKNQIRNNGYNSIDDKTVKSE